MTETAPMSEDEAAAEWKQLAEQTGIELIRNSLAWAFYNAGSEVIERMGSRITDLENQVERLTP